MLQNDTEKTSTHVNCTSTYVQLVKNKFIFRVEDNLLNLFDEQVVDSC